MNRAVNEKANDDGQACGSALTCDYYVLSVIYCTSIYYKRICIHTYVQYEYIDNYVNIYLHILSIFIYHLFV